jgi:serine/threonine-protein kinase
MKPENIYLVDGLSRVKILDFGIAKVVRGDARTNLTKTGAIFGTPNYMAPEQALGRKVDHRVDVYSMGVILYEMLTGHLPFRSDSFVAILTQHVMEPPEPPRRAAPERGIPIDVEELVLRAMAKDPAARPADMREMVSTLVDLRRRMFGDTPMQSHLNISRIRAPSPPRTTAPGMAGQPGKVTATAGELLPPLVRPRRWRGVIVGVTLGALAAGIGTVAAFIWLRKPDAVVAVAPGAPAADQGRVPPQEKPQRVTVIVSSEPQQATIELGGREVGTTPHVFRAKPGEALPLTLRLAGYKPASVQLVASAGLKHVEPLAPLAPLAKVTPAKTKTKLVAKKKAAKKGKKTKTSGHGGDDHSSDHGTDSHEVLEPY